MESQPNLLNARDFSRLTGSVWAIDFHLPGDARGAPRSDLMPYADQNRPLERRAQRRAAALALCALALASSCVSWEPPEEVRVGVSVYTGYAPLARALRTYEPPPGSARVRLHRFSSYSDSLRAFRNGRIDLAPMTQYDALMMHARGVPLRAVALIDRSLGADALVSQPEFRSLRHLRGGRIGLQIDSVSYFVLLQALDRHSLGIEEFEIVNMSQNLLESAFRERRLDAAVLWEPHVSKLGADAYPLATSRDLKIPIVDLLWVRADRLPSLRPHLLPLLRHYFTTLDHLAHDPRTMHVHLAHEDQATPEDTNLALRGLRLFAPDENVSVARRSSAGGAEPPEESALRATAEFLYSRTLLEVPLDVSGLFDGTLIVEALAAGSAQGQL